MKTKTWMKALKLRICPHSYQKAFLPDLLGWIKWFNVLRNFLDWMNKLEL